MDWKNESNGNTALLIEGARRIGKSTVVEEFGKNEYESYILIDFATASKTVKELFEDISDLNYLFLQLQLQYKVDLHERNSLIIFDEVQLCPLARQAIKSLGDTSTMPLLKKVYESKKPLGEQMNRKLLRDFRLYMLVGGMPQAVIEYIQTNNFRKVDIVKRDILSLYEDDFKKIDPTGKISLIFDAIPAQLNKNASRYQISSVLEGDRADRTLELIAQLKDSRTVMVAYHANDPNAGMSNNKDLAKYKLFLCDTGLFVTLMFKDKDFTENIIYEKLLNDKLNANLGYLYENVVAQLLAANGDELFYHTFMNESSRHNYEIDFLLARKNKVCPIEIKSSGYKAHASLDAFTQKFSDRILWRYLVYTKDLSKDEDIICLPVYVVPFL